MIHEMVDRDGRKLNKIFVNFFRMQRSKKYKHRELADIKKITLIDINLPIFIAIKFRMEGKIKIQKELI